MAWGQRLPYVLDLLRELVGREMKLRYKRSLLGIAWSLLNPLAQILVFSFLFRSVLPLQIPNYPSFVFIGVLAWSWFQSALMVATGSVTDNRELVRRPGFPAGVLPVVTVTTHLIHFLLALPVLGMFLVAGGIGIHLAILSLPLIIGLQFALTLSLSYLVAALHVTFRDTQHLLGVTLLLMFYLTPVFYHAQAVPARFQPMYRLNPMVHLLEAYRSVLLEGRLPPPAALLGLALLTGLLFALGYSVFRWASFRFVDEL